MKSLKTITDEGKREFEEKFHHLHQVFRDGLGGETSDQLEFYDFNSFLDTYAEKVATEVYEAIKIKGAPYACDEGCRTAMEISFKTFLGKV